MKNNNNEAIYSLRHQENDKTYHLDLIKGRYVQLVRNADHRIIDQKEMAVIR